MQQPNKKLLFKAVKTQLLNNAIYRFDGTSMLPSFKPGDTVLCIHREKKLIKGRLYAFVLNDVIAVHRFVTIKTNMAIFCGDNSHNFELIPNENVLVKISFSENRVIIFTIALINRIFFLLSIGHTLRIQLIWLLMGARHDKII
jgi:hypothetical protein